jgi:hypothetical protein
VADLSDVQPSENRGQRDGRQDQGPAQVSGDQDGAAAQPVYPHTRHQAEEQHRGAANGLQDAHLKGCGLEGDQSQQR